MITASRSWDRPEAIWAVLDIIASNAAAVGETQLTVVHGCAKGGDTHADEWVRKGEHPLQVTAERHPPDWSTHGKRAGFVRNATMVHGSADICLAFIRSASKGASGTADLAERAGITVQRFEYIEDTP